jgi:hypothetical protein
MPQFGITLDATDADAPHTSRDSEDDRRESQTDQAKRHKKSEDTLPSPLNPPIWTGGSPMDRKSLWKRIETHISECKKPSEHQPRHYGPNRAARDESRSWTEIGIPGYTGGNPEGCGLAIGLSGDQMN